MNDVNSKGYIAKLTITLFIITAVVALLLSFVNALTKDTIAERAAAELSKALAEVMPEATDPFAEPVYEGVEGTVYEATAGGEVIGWCIQVASNGYGGAITMVVGVDAELSVTGVSIVDMSETAGLGSKADSPSFLGQYVGRSGVINVKSGDNAIDAISGATVTSKAVTAGVNAALDLAAQMKGV